MVSFRAKQTPAGCGGRPHHDDGDGGSHWPSAGTPRSRTPTPPYTDCATGLLIPVVRNRTRFIEIAIHLRRTRPDIPHLENGPFLLERRVPGRKSMIAV